jgi:glycosyltransferase involved in cell wall biosynthesis
MAVYNGERYIEKSILSVKNQKYQNWKLIIVNDNSTDSTKKILEKYKSNKIKIINLKKNIGAYKAISIAIKFVDGKYTSFLDSDDIFHPAKLAAQVDILENNQEVALVATWYKIFKEKNFIKKKIKITQSEKNFKNIYPCINIICNSSVMIRSRLFKIFKFYNKNIIYAYDYNFFLQIFKKYKFFIIKNFYTYYRIHDNQRSKSKKLKKIIFKENIYFLNWSKKNKLINKYNILYYYWRYIVNYFKIFFY